MNSETISVYRNTHWSSQQVHILSLIYSCVQKGRRPFSKEEIVAASVFASINLQLIGYASYEPFRILILHSHQLPSG